MLGRRVDPVEKHGGSGLERCLHMMTADLMSRMLETCLSGDAWVERCGAVAMKRQERAEHHGLSAALVTPQAFLPSAVLFLSRRLYYQVTGETHDS